MKAYINGHTEVIKQRLDNILTDSFQWSDSPLKVLRTTQWCK